MYSSDSNGAAFAFARLSLDGGAFVPFTQNGVFISEVKPDPIEVFSTITVPCGETPILDDCCEFLTTDDDKLCEIVDILEGVICEPEEGGVTCEVIELSTSLSDSNIGGVATNAPMSDPRILTYDYSVVPLAQYEARRDWLAEAINCAADNNGFSYILTDLSGVGGSATSAFPIASPTTSFASWNDATQEITYSIPVTMPGLTPEIVQCLDLGGIDFQGTLDFWHGLVNNIPQGGFVGEDDAPDTTYCVQIVETEGSDGGIKICGFDELVDGVLCIKDLLESVIGDCPLCDGSTAGTGCCIDLSDRPTNQIKFGFNDGPAIFATEENWTVADLAALFVASAADVYADGDLLCTEPDSGVTSITAFTGEEPVTYTFECPEPTEQPQCIRTGANCPAPSIGDYMIPKPCDGSGDTGFGECPCEVETSQFDPDVGRGRDQITWNGTNFDVSWGTTGGIFSILYGNANHPCADSQFVIMHMMNQGNSNQPVGDTSWLLIAQNQITNFTGGAAGGTLTYDPSVAPDLSGCTQASIEAAVLAAQGNAFFDAGTLSTLVSTGYVVTNGNDLGHGVMNTDGNTFWINGYAWDIAANAGTADHFPGNQFGRCYTLTPDPDCVPEEELVLPTYDDCANGLLQELVDQGKCDEVCDPIITYDTVCNDVEQTLNDVTIPAGYPIIRRIETNYQNIDCVCVPVGEGVRFFDFNNPLVEFTDTVAFVGACDPQIVSEVERCDANGNTVTVVNIEVGVADGSAVTTVFYDQNGQPVVPALPLSVCNPQVVREKLCVYAANGEKLATVYQYTQLDTLGQPAPEFTIYTTLEGKPYELPEGATLDCCTDVCEIEANKYCYDVSDFEFTCDTSTIEINGDVVDLCGENTGNGQIPSSGDLCTVGGVRSGQYTNADRCRSAYPTPTGDVVGAAAELQNSSSVGATAPSTNQFTNVHIAVRGTFPISGTAPSIDFSATWNVGSGIAVGAYDCSTNTDLPLIGGTLNTYDTGVCGVQTTRGLNDAWGAANNGINHTATFDTSGVSDLQDVVFYTIVMGSPVEWLSDIQVNGLDPAPQTCQIDSVETLITVLGETTGTDWFVEGEQICTVSSDTLGALTCGETSVDPTVTPENIFKPCAECACDVEEPATNTHLIEGCIEVEGEKVSAFTIIGDDGTPLFAPKPLTDLGFVEDCC